MTTRPTLGDGLYRRLLGPAWEQLDEGVRRAHPDADLFRGVGTLRVRHRPGRFAAMLLRLTRAPAADEALPARVLVTRLGPATERWEREFGGTRLVSLQQAGPDGILVERFGALEFHFRLVVLGGALEYRQVGVGIRAGPFWLPLPNRLLPRAAGREEPGGGPDRTRVRIAVRGPAGQAFFSYDGVVRWSEGPP